MAFHLEHDESLRGGLRRILVEQTIRLGEDIAGTDKDRKTAIHEVRKRCKRVRGVLRLLRPHAETLYQEENVVFREVARKLSPFRDADARLEAFDALLQPPDCDGPRFSSIREFLTDTAQNGNSTNEFTSRIATIAKEAQDAQKRFKAMDFWEGDGFDLIEPGLRKTYKRGQQAMTMAYRGEPEKTAFHEWRKRVKDLGYQLQVLRELWPPVLKRLHKEVDDLGRLLGQDHDITVLQQSVQDPVSGRVSKGDLSAFLDFIGKRAGELREQALPIGERIYAEESEDFTKRMRAYWHTWREEGAVAT
ncbi:MAG TPA: CHAD domain-containing protein [Chthoniobacterales bacterium]